MIKIKDIINVISKNPGKNINYDNFTMQIYNNQSNLQANIRYKNVVIVKFEQRTEGTISVYLPSENDDTIIEYTTGCSLQEDDTIFKIYDFYKENMYVEQVMAALFLLK